MRHDALHEQLIGGAAVVRRLVSLLETPAAHDAGWLGRHAARGRDELTGLLGRMLETTRAEWESGEAASCLSPLDAQEIRDALLTASYASLRFRLGVNEADARDAETLADALDAYLARR